MNQFQILELEKILKVVYRSTEGVRTSLNQMNLLFQDAIGDNGYAWSGEEALRFKAAWNGLVDDIPEYINIVENQATNIELALSKVQEIEEK